MVFVTAKDVMIFIVAGGIVASVYWVSSPTPFFMLGYKDAIISLIAQGVNDVPTSYLCLIFGMETHGPMFVICTSI